MAEKKRQKIMLVDDNMANLTIGKSMLKDIYEVYALYSADQLFSFLERVTPDLILLDIEMPVMDGYEVIKILKSDKRFSEIPVIFLTSKNESSSELEGLTLGAIDYVTKPFSASLLLKRIENHLLIQRQKKELKEFNENLMGMVQKKTKQVFELQNSIICSVAELIEFRDGATGWHICRTQKYLQMLLEKLIQDGTYSDEIISWDMDFLLPSAQLHDVGKIAISDTILNKPGKLSAEEFEIMKTHTEKGVEAISRMERNEEERAFLKHAKIFAGNHHEKWDGSGYPQGLRGHSIPLEGRLMAIVDVYDALISVRSYKRPYSPKESARIIIENSGTHFDPYLVDIFKKNAEEFAEVAAE